MLYNALYAVIHTDPHGEGFVLELRNQIGPVSGLTMGRNEHGDIVLNPPDPIIEIGSGGRDDLFGLAAKLFGARWGAWDYDGDDYSYQLVDHHGQAAPQLTPRERSVVNALAAKPGQTVDDLCLFLKIGQPDDAGPTQAHIKSALRFLLESGFLVTEVYETKPTTYTVRRT